MTATEHLIDGQSLSGYWQVFQATRYDGGLSGTWNETVEYTQGPVPIGQRTISATGGSSLFLHGDAQASTRVVSDASGSVVAEYAYDAFGRRLGDATGLALTEILYHGRPFDAVANHYQIRARYYVPETGRFHRSDPLPGDALAPLSLHRYLFAQSDPVNNSDPTGLFTLAGVSVSNAIRVGLDFGVRAYATVSALGVLREGTVGATNYNQIVHQPRTLNNATIITHGVSGLPIGQSRTFGWSERFQQDLKRTGLTTSDFVEFTWSGFDVSGFGIVPNRSVHYLTLSYYDLVLRTTWSKGYDKIHIVGHSWGTALSYDLLERSAVPIQHWVTLGSPLRADTPKPWSVAGDWVDFYSNSDPTTWLNIHPPFGILGALRATWQSAAVRVNANFSRNRTGMVVAHPGTFLDGLLYEHSAYWDDFLTMIDLVQVLR
jgi:RHS repeat-associated protein